MILFRAVREYEGDHTRKIIVCPEIQWFLMTI